MSQSTKEALEALLPHLGLSGWGLNLAKRGPESSGRRLELDLGAAGLPRQWFTAPQTLAFPVEDHSDQQTRGELTIDWEALESRAQSCTSCRLCEGRNRVVFGTGKRERPLIAFVGEGPGADEDRIGEPFVGKAGALLTAAITKGMGLRREDVYIANVVKCRPPENRAPLPDEVAACVPYLYRQLELLQPQVIVTLGQPAQLALSGIEMGITKLRGRWQKWREIPLMPTFHPAYILRNASAKRPFWEDLQSVMVELKLPVPNKSELGGASSESHSTD